MARPEPTLEMERSLFDAGVRLVAGIDEVGRGAIAGPVTIGVALIDANVGPVPDGLRDSKLMTAPKREAMVPLLATWARQIATGSASAAEIDRFGIVSALGLAASRALAMLHETPEVVIVDGNTAFLVAEPGGPEVMLRTKADQDVACVAAASVVAKVERDATMRHLHETHPHYGWLSNKGYGAKVHTDAIAVHGTCEHHRTSWNITPR